MTELRRLQYFLGVARERNFTRAADQLHVAQPALSRQVRLLEEELGVDLLHRTTHEFELTDGPHHHRAVGMRASNGINAFMEVVSRATFAVSPRARRAYLGQVSRTAGLVSPAA